MEAAEAATGAGVGTALGIGSGARGGVRESGGVCEGPLGRGGAGALRSATSGLWVAGG